MKFLLVLAIIVLSLFIITQIFSMRGANKIEKYNYKVFETFDEFEIRTYESRIFTYVTMNSNSYNESSGMGFRWLAGYIFGGNDRNQKIAMTSPVAMSFDDSITMMFMVPSGYTQQTLPKPNNSAVQFKTEPERTVAAIQFGGWASDERIEKYINKLKTLLAEQNINHANKFSYLGYNPPFELLGRRNEIIVEVYF